jgi:hypothetical protein
MMAREAECRCLGCGVNVTKASVEAGIALRNVFARIAICPNCNTGKHARTLRETYRRECLKAYNTVATR